MTDDLSTKTCCVFDNGLFTSLAETLSASFARVYYHSPWAGSFPRSRTSAIGSGLPGVIRADYIEDIEDEVDLFVFPDLFHGPKQKKLRDAGKRVWGAGRGEALEVERPQSKQWLRDIGLPVGGYRIVTGMNDLRRHLQRHDNQHVKIASRFRGDMETFHAKTYDLIEPRLGELEHTLGALKDEMVWVCEDDIQAKAEVGYDGFTIDGQYPQKALFGVETKDAGYVGQVTPYSAIPRPLGYVNTKLSPLFRELQYRGFFSSEIRIGEDNTPYLIDPCCRMASPPGELYQYLIENLAEVLWYGADGELVEPVWRHLWGAQVILKSDWAEHGWQPIDYPEELGFHVKLHYMSVIMGKRYYVPQAVTMPEIGAVVAGGSSKEEAIAAAKDMAEQVKGYDVEFNIAALEEAAAGMDKVKRAA